MSHTVSSRPCFAIPGTRIENPGLCTRGSVSQFSLLCLAPAVRRLSHRTLAAMAAPGRRISRRQAEKVEKDTDALHTQRSLEKIQQHLTDKPQLVPKVLCLFSPVPQQRTAQLEGARLFLLARSSLLAVHRGPATLTRPRPRKMCQMTFRGAMFVSATCQSGRSMQSWRRWSPLVVPQRLWPAFATRKTMPSCCGLPWAFKLAQNCQRWSSAHGLGCMTGQSSGTRPWGTGSTSTQLMHPQPSNTFAF